MKRNIKILPLVVALCSAMACDKSDPGDRVYDNQVYIDEYEPTANLYISTENEYIRTLAAAIPKPAESDINIMWDVDKSLVAHYNDANGTDAVMLPSTNYIFMSRKDVIGAGNIRSNSVSIEFVDVLSLDKEQLYVLPVSIKEADIKILESRSTKYFVFEGANLVNVVADMHENYCEVDWKNPDVVTGMRQITFEFLVNSTWGEGITDVGINSIMGIEAYMLIRCGNINEPANRMTVCVDGIGGSALPFPVGPGLPANEWVHVAVTYDCDAEGQCNIYINGKFESKHSGKIGNKFGTEGINLNISAVNSQKDKFAIGRSYNNDRYLCGSISECRIWNRVLTAEEISEPFHAYNVDPKSEGLVCYWKFNEGTGDTVVDHTGNGNDAKASKPIKWKNVSLPETN